MNKIIFFAILVLFPFGQLLKIGIFNLFDVAVFILAVVTILSRPKYPNWFRYFIYFVLTCIFSLLVNYKLIDTKSVLYLVRLTSYSFVAIYIFNFVKDKKALISALLSISIFSAIFGWIQYFIWPDLTALKYLGWDDHLLRMVGFFLDPTYLGLIIVLGIIIAVENNGKNILYKYSKWILYFLLISLAFTYSRSSYLIASLFLLFRRKYLAIIVFAVTIFLLPKMIGEGTNLARTVSGNNKITNYSETLKIIKESPVFGIGFNNMCNARKIYLNDINTESHACSGADSSILFLLATTGIIGLILFISFVVRIPAIPLLMFSFFAVLIHSFFANSLFYPHIMFWMWALVGLQTEVNSKTS